MAQQAWKVPPSAWLSRESLVVERGREVRKQEKAEEATLLSLSL